MDYGDMTIEKLKTDTYQAQTRNKLIVEAFYLTNDIEKYGSGYIRVREEIKEYPTMKFEYEEVGNGYLVTISYEKQKVNSKVNEGVNEGVKSLYAIIKKYPNKKTPFFANELNTSVKNIERWIKQLKDEGKIEFRGSPKTGGYFEK